ncbi:serine carboxypeptidase-like 18 [Amborella trichopoda]|uniref:serine carboxypeptidase-like 18 n=1 Tax=Amborella trichopoda TaxID=13333 RepID=UPI0009BF09FC|nr:serine carboxypeptidase-like 18 [Amborella trichopoda]|eukprot:XP_020520356.1 serine carboxypeptidase-like 18 [Amborella trichopoda]
MTLDEEKENRQFYYFAKSENNSEEDLLLLWLTGCPECSAFSSLVFKIGPLRFEVAEYDGTLPSLRTSLYSWTQVANIIFLDSTTGTGFSYPNAPQDYKSLTSRLSRTSISFFFSCIKQWFIKYPEFLSNPLYIAGDSYSEITVPVLTYEIANGIDAGYKPVFNLKGYLLGNPVTQKEYDTVQVPAAHRMGLVSDELYEIHSSSFKCEWQLKSVMLVELMLWIRSCSKGTVCEGCQCGKARHLRFLHSSGQSTKLLDLITSATKESCQGLSADPTNEECVLNIQAVLNLTSRINLVQILEPYVSESYIRLRAMWQQDEHSSYTTLLLTSPLFVREYGYFLSYYWANNETVRDALHVKMGTTKEWKRCNRKLNFQRDVASSIPYHLNLTARGYFALIYRLSVYHFFFVILQT